MERCEWRLKKYYFTSLRSFFFSIYFSIFNLLNIILPSHYKHSFIEILYLMYLFLTWKCVYYNILWITSQWDWCGRCYITMSLLNAAFMEKQPLLSLKKPIIVYRPLLASFLGEYYFKNKFCIINLCVRNKYKNIMILCRG